MKFKSNIGIIDALIRITCGLTILSYCTAKLARKPWKQSYLILALLGAMKVGEGILKYCPVTDYAESNQNQNGQKMNKSSSEKKTSTTSGEKPQLKQLIDMFIPKQEQNQNNNQQQEANESKKVNNINKDNNNQENHSEPQDNQSSNENNNEEKNTSENNN